MAKAEPKPKMLDVEAELTSCDAEEQKLIDEHDELVGPGSKLSYEDLRERLRGIAGERRALEERRQALYQARRLGSEQLRALHQLITDVGGVEALAEVGTPSTED